MEDEPQQFELVKKLTDKVWLAKRHIDGEHFVAKLLDDFDDYYQARHDGFGHVTKHQRQLKGLMDLIYEHNIGRNISHILNHENLVSLAGHLRQKPLNSTPFDERQATDDYLVWDHCDAGTLAMLVRNRSPLQTNEFLPESLCWHVITSVMRALAWLHDGYRREINWETGASMWVQTDTDWMPILHRDIQSNNIMFQHPRGTETYGICKLARYGKAFVSGHPGDRFPKEDDESAPQYFNAHGIVSAPPVTLAPGMKSVPNCSMSELQKASSFYKAGKEKKIRPYTISDEHWALGAVLWSMMTATVLPSRDPCQFCEKHCVHLRACGGVGGLCVFAQAEEEGLIAYGNEERCEHTYGGCSHVKNLMGGKEPYVCRDNKWKSGCRCPRGCRNRDRCIDDELVRLHYSKFLIRAVRRLFDWDWKTPARTSWGLCNEIDSLYRHWKQETAEGREYVDVHDDARRRYHILNQVDQQKEG